MSKRFAFVFGLLLVVSIITTACASASVGVGPATSGTSTVPSYATYRSALYAAYYESPLKGEDGVQFLSDRAKDNEVVEEGFVGILLPDSFLYKVLYDGSNYGQTCSFNYGSDALDYGVETKMLTLHVQATILNQDFLSWCRSQIPNKAELYVVSASKAEGGFAIQYTREEWVVKAIFRLGN